MRFVVFNASGHPVRAGGCPEAMVHQQAGEGETAVPWPHGSPKGWRLVDGELVAP